MNTDRFDAITQKYRSLRIAVVGDFCLDRYLEIDPSKQEISIETGLPVYNVTKVRAQPGGAGTVLNNLVALGVGQIFPVGFAGDDGEGYELRWSMAEMPGVRLDYFIQTRTRQTFTYCKPLVIEPGKPPRELNRLDKKNWSPTPPVIAEQLSANVLAVAAKGGCVDSVGAGGSTGDGRVDAARVGGLGDCCPTEPQTTDAGRQPAHVARLPAGGFQNERLRAFRPQGSAGDGQRV